MSKKVFIKQYCDICGFDHSYNPELENLPDCVCPECGQNKKATCFGTNDIKHKKLQSECYICRRRMANEANRSKKKHRNEDKSEEPTTQVSTNNNGNKSEEPTTQVSTNNNGNKSKQPVLTNGEKKFAEEMFNIETPYVTTKLITKGTETIAVGQLLCLGMNAWLDNTVVPNRKWDIVAESPLEIGVQHKIDVTSTVDEFKTKCAKLSTWQDGNCHICFVDPTNFGKIQIEPSIIIKHKIV